MSPNAHHKEDTVTATEVVEKARTHLLLSKNGRFFGGLSTRLPLVEKEGFGMIATDGENIIFDPVIVAKYSDLETMKTIVAHEVCHIILEHHYRFRNETDFNTVNIACDYVVNLLLHEAGFKLPKDCLFDMQYKGMNAEEVLNILKRRGRDQKNKEQKNNNEGDSSKDPNGGNSNQSNSPGNSGTGQPNKSSGGNNIQSDDKGEVKAPSWGKVLNAPKEKENEKKQAWQTAIKTAVKICGGYGSLPGGAAEMVKGMLEPQVPWTVLLRDFVDRTAKNDYTYSRPNRRYINQGLIFPVLQSDELMKILFVVDTSGSISEENLKEAQSELQDILNVYNIVLEVHYVDYKHYPEKTQIFEKYDTVELKPFGRGGTRFEPIFEYIKQTDEEPACLIYFTDLEGTFPKEEPYYPVLWINIGRSSITPPFGEYYKREL